jgi:hypothetical protein
MPSQIHDGIAFPICIPFDLQVPNGQSFRTSLDVRIARKELGEKTRARFV